MYVTLIRAFFDPMLRQPASSSATSPPRRWATMDKAAHRELADRFVTLRPGSGKAAAVCCQAETNQTMAYIGIFFD
jgi:hypothetical protein